MGKFNLLAPKVEAELINFTQHLVRIKSVTGDEEKITAFIEKKMKEMVLLKLLISLQIVKVILMLFQGHRLLLCN